MGQEMNQAIEVKRINRFSMEAPTDFPKLNVNEMTCGISPSDQTAKNAILPGFTNKT